MAFDLAIKAPDTPVKCKTLQGLLMGTDSCDQFSHMGDRSGPPPLTYCNPPARTSVPLEFIQFLPPGGSITGGGGWQERQAAAVRHRTRWCGGGGGWGGFSAKDDLDQEQVIRAGYFTNLWKEFKVLDTMIAQNVSLILWAISFCPTWKRGRLVIPNSRHPLI